MAWDNGSWVRFGVGLLLLEFILLHSGAFVSAMLARGDSFAAKLKILLPLMSVYALMVWGFSLSLGTTSLLWIFAAVCLGRLISGIGNTNEQIGVMRSRSAIGVCLYMFVVFLSVMLPVPEWGITHSVLEAVYPDRGGGEWEQEPQRAIAAAALYFTLLGVAELNLMLLKPGSDETINLPRAG